MATLSLENVKKSYGPVDVIHGVDLQIEDGEFVVFVGPSGCGKSTLLRMIAGLEEITDGIVNINEQVVNDVAPSKRGVAMVFQTYALYPHMTVKENMEFGLKQAKTDPAEIEKRVMAAAEVLQINTYLDRVPKNLSGGQRQRVAIGRAIVRDPEVFLFDEPLSNLDASLRVQTRLEIARLHSRLGATMIYVTHDQVEAMTLADKIVVLKDGYISQVGAPLELYGNPDNQFVAGFIGSPKMNFLPGTIAGNKLVMPAGKKVAFKAADANVNIGLRPEHLSLATKDKAVCSAKLDMLEQLGEYVLAHMKTDDGLDLIAKFDSAPDAKMGDTLHLGIDMANVHVFDAQSELRIDPA